MQKEKNSARKQMKKIVKRINSTSMGRSSLPLTARNFHQPNAKKINFNKKYSENQVKLGSSDGHSNRSCEDTNVPKNSRYEQSYKQFEKLQDARVNFDKNQRVSLQSYNMGVVTKNHVKHAIANLADPSNDYSEDMDESVAFSKGFSDKENMELQRTKMSVYENKRKNKKEFRAYRSGYPNTTSTSNYASKASLGKGHKAQNLTKRRVSQYNTNSKIHAANSSRVESNYRSTAKSSIGSNHQLQNNDSSSKDIEPICDDVSESDVYTDEYKYESTPISKPHQYNTFSSNKKFSCNKNCDLKIQNHDSDIIDNKIGLNKNNNNKILQTSFSKVTIPFHKPKFIDNVKKVPRKVTNSLKKYGFK